MLTSSQSLFYLKKKGFDIVRFFIFTTEKELKEKVRKFFPCFLKADTFLHKEENGLLVLVNEKKELNKFRILKRNASKLGIRRFIIEEREEGKEFFIGIKNDIIFGKVICIGKEKPFFRLSPLTKKEATKMLKKGNLPLTLNTFLVRLSRLDIEEGDFDIILSNKPKIIDARIKILRRKNEKES